MKNNVEGRRFPFMRKHAGPEAGGFKKQLELEKGRVKTGAAFLRVVGIIWGKEVRDRVGGVYAYVRAIDDIVDSGQNPGNAKALLQSERVAINSFLDDTPNQNEDQFPERRYLLQGIAGLPRDKQGRILHSVLEMFDGFAVDAELIESKMPISEGEQRKRHIGGVKAPLQIINELVFDRPLLHEPNERFDDLMVHWSIYDALRDLGEDLSAGLTLFPAATLEQYGIELIPGQPVPEHMENLFHEYKPMIINNLKTDARVVYQAQMPLIFATALWLYFKTRARKLKKSEYSVTSQTVFGGSNSL